MPSPADASRSSVAPSGRVCRRSRAMRSTRMITMISATSAITISTAPTMNGRVASICRSASASSASLSGGAS